MGHFLIVKLLIDNGADITAEDNYPIIAASKYGDFLTVKLLIEYGADITAQNNSPIIRASEYGSEKVSLFRDILK